MTHARTFLTQALRFGALALAVALPCGAWADDFSDINQLMRAGKFNEALIRADQHLAAKPRDAQMRFLKGVVQTEAGRTADAMASFVRLTEEFPELPEPYNNLAVLYAGQSQFDKARVALEMAIRNNPTYAVAHANLGDVYAKLATQSYARAVQLDATNTSVPPKLALIRELFAPGSRAGRTGGAPLSTTTAAAKPAVNRTVSKE